MDPGTEEPAALDTNRHQVVRVEANFLRLPLFALDKKHLRQMDGIRCEGTFRKGGKTIPFAFSATRNVRTFYPGPVSRSAHFALLSLATDAGLPVTNPIVFTWHELCARMGIHCSGKTVRELRQALLATKGLMIESHHALYSKAEGRTIDAEESVDRIVNLYDELEFYGTRRADGTTADVNAVWLSRWYLDNLNALYSGPLDFGLWQQLNASSWIASRLYEFLFLKFYSGHPQLRFNYATLVKFIPIRTERYLSQAKKQLGPALALLVERGILAEAVWQQSAGGAPQLVLVRGPVLARVPAATAQLAGDVAEEDFVLDQVAHAPLPEWEIVSEFHRLWGHENFRPSKAELEAAQGFLRTYGSAQLRALLPAVVKRMRMKWPDAKTFVAVNRYLVDVAGEFRRRQFSEQREAQAAATELQARQAAAGEVQELAVLRTAWDALPASEQEAIRAAVLTGQPRSLTKFPKTLERLCLQELGRRGGPAAA